MDSRIIARGIILFALYSAFSCSANTPGENQVAVGEKLIRGFADFWTSKDLNQLDALYTHDAVYEDVPDGTAYEGLEAIKKSLSEDITYAPDVRVEVVSILVSEDRGALEWVWSGTQTGDIPGLMPATGKPFSVRGVSLFEFESNKIKKQSDYYDAGTFLHQLGVQFEFPETRQQ
jgi:steroid delta-isomerase-like uncharacterized protein